MITPLPQMAGDGSVRLRSWTESDAEELAALVTANVEHLRPWLPWIAGEPMSVPARRSLIRSWNEDHAAGGDGYYGVFVGGVLVGGCGLHHRIGARGLEIGYWIAHAHTRRGYATSASKLLTGTAFGLPDVDRVEIHTDRANVASARVPTRLGFTLIEERPDEVLAPAESGVLCVWRMERSTWLRRAANA
jgi:ribosomal-protein-serine acetyltransferase